MANPALEVADIFRIHGPAWRQNRRGHLSPGQLKVMSAIEQCRSAALGGHVLRCDACGTTEVSYNSCRNRHCPKCQSGAAQRCLEARQSDLLPVEYFHVVFALPAPIADLAYQNKTLIYGLLFDVAAEVLTTIAADPKHLGARIGATFVSQQAKPKQALCRNASSAGRGPRQITTGLAREFRREGRGMGRSEHAAKSIDGQSLCPVPLLGISVDGPFPIERGVAERRTARRCKTSLADDAQCVRPFCSAKATGDDAPAVRVQNGATGTPASAVLMPFAVQRLGNRTANVVWPLIDCARTSPPWPLAISRAM